MRPRRARLLQLVALALLCGGACVAAYQDGYRDGQRDVLARLRHTQHAVRDEMEAWERDVIALQRRL